jgi:hypothetical protein
MPELPERLAVFKAGPVNSMGAQVRIQFLTARKVPPARSQLNAEENR